MAEETDQHAPKPGTGIHALPPTTVRQIGSSQVLVDPTSVVKELVDNALDARATAVFVDVSANLIDSIQVKDNGHGISGPDRALVCRRYCTSKIRNFDELKGVGGKWLGFRGEAMASMAEMSGNICVTTRVEGEPVAVLLKFDRGGELVSTERASHPVGTIVKVTDFFRHLPVRKQDALKQSTQFIGNAKRLMQAYALARPTVRFQLRILKAKSDKGNFNYAPTVRANVEDAAFKVIGRECASQCDWTAIETDGFEICAFLPKPDAVAAKVGGYGAFLSIDSRPVSPARGTMKKIVSTFKDKVRTAGPSLSAVKDPFMCMNIICPPDSYDPNIEPAKDDLLFEDPDMVIQAVGKLLDTFYPKIVCDGYEPPTSAQPARQLDEEAASDGLYDAQEDKMRNVSRISPSIPRQGSGEWRTTMYGIDEEEPELLTVEDQARSLHDDDEGERRAPEVSNPWTIAKMNALNKPKIIRGPPQLLTPARSAGDIAMASSSPSRGHFQTTPRATGPLTPQTISRAILTQSSNREELAKGVQHRALSGQRVDPAGLSEGEALPLSGPKRFQSPRSPIVYPSGGHSSGEIPRRSQRKPPAFNNQSFASPLKGIGDPDDTWFGQPSTSTDSRPKRKPNSNAPPLFPSQRPSSFGIGGTGLVVAERLHDSLTLDADADIRDFFARKRLSQQTSQKQAQQDTSHDAPAVPSFTPINPGPKRTRGQRAEQAVEDGMTEILEGWTIEARSRAEPECEAPLRALSGNQTSGRPRSAPHRRDRNLSPSPTPGPSTRPQQRRRTTDHAHTHLTRSKSSKLPLERIPADRRTTSLSLTLSVSLAKIVTQSRKLNMGIYAAGGNSLEWGYPAEECYVDDGGVFSGVVVEVKVWEWAERVCGLLDRCLDREGDEVDVVEVLREGICKGLEEIRCEDDGEEDGEVDEAADEEMLLV